MNKIEVDVNRIGGGFGGKEDQASPWAAMVALACYLTNRPVKYILERGGRPANDGEKAFLIKVAIK